MSRRRPLVAFVCIGALTMGWPRQGHAESPAPTADPSAAAPTAAPTAGPPGAASEPTDEKGWPVAQAKPAAAGPDEVTLQSGGFVRGTIVELEPGTRLVILVDGTGERRELTWDKIAEVERGKHSAAAPSNTTTAASPPEPTVGEGRPRIHLDVERRKSVTLFEVDSEIVAGGYNTSVYGVKFRSVCAAPCDRVVDGSRGQDFFLGTGEGAIWTASRKFTLAQQSGNLDIHVKPGNRGLRIAGAILLGFGIGFGVGGAVLVIPKATRLAGVGMLAGGIPALLAGIPMMIFGRTRYELGARDPQNDP